MAYLRMMRGDVDAVQILVDRSLRAGGETIDPLVRIRSLNNRGMAANMRHYPDGHESLDQARALAAADGLWSRGEPRPHQPGVGREREHGCQDRRGLRPASHGHRRPS